MFTLRQLEIFLAVAQHEHVSQAAQTLSLSQSAVSMAIAELEASLDGPLFERVGRGLRLNSRGKLLKQDAASLLQQAQQMRDRLASTSGELTGELRVGASSTIGIYLMPQIIGRFMQQHPQTTVELDIGNTEQVEHRLANCELDLGFTEGPLQHRSLVSKPWREDELVIFASRDHELAQRKQLSKTDMRQARWIFREPGSGTREVFAQALQRQVGHVEASMTFGHTEAVKQAVAAGLGLACLSRLTIQRGIEQGVFVVLRMPRMNLRRQLWIVTRRQSYGNRLATAFIDFAKQPGNSRILRSR